MNSHHEYCTKTISESEQSENSVTIETLELSGNNLDTFKLPSTSSNVSLEDKQKHAQWQSTLHEKDAE